MPVAQQQTIKKLEEQLKFKRWGVHNSYDDHIKKVLTHEYGHALSDQFIGMINKERANPSYRINAEIKKINDEWEGIYLKAKQNGDIFNISEYGSKNSDELFAESFVMYDANEKLPDYIYNFIKKVIENGIM